MWLVPSTVSSDASSAFARLTPAWYGVAGSFVVEMTYSFGKPSTCGRCGSDVGGTGQKSQGSLVARGGSPESMKGAAAAYFSATVSA